MLQWDKIRRFQVYSETDSDLLIRLLPVLKSKLFGHLDRSRWQITKEVTLFNSLE